jgi:hypothetical protein
MKNKFSLVVIISLSSLFSAYDVGDQISVDHQNMEFGFCHPKTQVGVCEDGVCEGGSRNGLLCNTEEECPDNSFSFAQHNGDLNGGDYRMLLIEVSTSW